MSMALYTIFLVCAAGVAWLIVIFGWPPIEFVHAPVAQEAPHVVAPQVTVDLQHITKIFDSWAAHSNLVALCFVGVFGIAVWGMVMITKIHVSARPPLYEAPQPRALEIEKPREEFRGKLLTKD